MKINEIIIREIPDPEIDADDGPSGKKLDKTKGPTDNQRFKGRTGAPEPRISQADRDAMFFAYRGDPEFRNYVQFAMSQPHIKTMPQAIAYATAELAARNKRGEPGMPDVRGDLAKKGLQPWGTGPDATSKAVGFKRIKRDIIDTPKGGASIPGLSQIKGAVSDLADWAGEKIGLQTKVSTSTRAMVGHGKDIAKDLRS